MKLEDLHPTMIEALAIHEFARCLAYTADDLFLHVLTGMEKVAVTIKHEGREAHILAGPWLGDTATTTAAWTAAVSWWNLEATNDERMSVFESSRVRRGAVKTLMDLRNAGLPIHRRDVAKAG